MKLFKLIKEESEMHKITPKERKMLNLLNKLGVDPLDPGEVWGALVGDPLYIGDEELALRLIYIFTKHWRDPDDEDETFNDLVSIDLSNFTKLEDYDDEIRALSIETGTPPFMFERADYRHYELPVYRDLLENTEWAIGTDIEVEDSLETYARDEIEYLDNFEEWWLEQYLSPNDYAIEEFVEDYVENRLRDMDESEIIEEAGYDAEDMENTIEEYEGKKEELEEEMEELESEIEELRELLEEMEEEDEEAFISDEYQQLEEEISDKESERDDKESDMTGWEEEAQDLREKLYGLEETATEELKEKYMEDMISEIENDGLSYFTDHYGMDREDAIQYYFDFDSESAISDLAGESDWGSVLSTSTGDYNEHDIGNETYFTFEL